MDSENRKVLAIGETCMDLALSTWCDVESYLQHRRDIILPIGSTEQHGPTGLIGTDFICAEVIARQLAEQTGAALAPTLPFGMAHYHLGFPGTISLRPSTYVKLVVDIIASLARHGFTRIWFVNGHGGNIAPVTAAIAEHLAASSYGAASRSEVECRLCNWWEMPNVVALVSELYGDEEGLHGQPSEVAVTQHAFPKRIKPLRLNPPVAPTGSFTDAADYRARFPDGRLGSNPSLATPEAGARLVEAASHNMAADYLLWIA